jgi:hypothetical protein
MCRLDMSNEGACSVLVAYPPGQRADELAEAFRAAGYQVVSCEGPVVGRGCVLVDDGGTACLLAEQVDAIVLGVVDDQRTDDLFFRVRRCHRESPLIVLDARVSGAVERAPDRATVWATTLAQVVEEVDRRVGPSPVASSSG